MLQSRENGAEPTGERRGDSLWPVAGDVAEQVREATPGRAPGRVAAWVRVGLGLGVLVGACAVVVGVARRAPGAERTAETATARADREIATMEGARDEGALTSAASHASAERARDGAPATRADEAPKQLDVAVADSLTPASRSPALAPVRGPRVHRAAPRRRDPDLGPVIQPHLARLRHTCFEPHAAAWQRTATVVVDVVVEGGRAKSVNARGDQSAVEQCVAKDVATWRFPKWDGVKSIEVPLHFATQAP
jgi:hypothetical protein